MNTEADRIHAAIMNLPINGASELINRPESKQVRYKLGHRDACHAAAEIVQRSIAKLERENAKMREACEAALAYIPGSEVRSWPPGFELRKKAIEQLRAVLAQEGERE